MPLTPSLAATYCLPVAPTPYGTGARPHFYKWLCTGGTMSRRTASKNTIKLYWPSRRRSWKRLIVLVESKKWRGTTKNFRHFAPDICPIFKSVPTRLLPTAEAYTRGYKKCVPLNLSSISHQQWDVLSLYIGSTGVHWLCSIGLH